MKKITSKYGVLLLLLLLTSNLLVAQVGINTTDPKGILDITSANMGVVYPNVSLTAANSSSPVTNPQGGAIVAGTVVYNTNTTFNGTTNDVYPGIYVWDGSKWIIHYKKRQSELFDQTAEVRTDAQFTGSWQDITGLGVATANTFTAQFSGLYRIEVKSNFGGGKMDVNSSITVAAAKGRYRFTFDGTSNLFETQAFSAYNSFISGGTHYSAIWKESYNTYYVNLTAGQAYPFSLEFDAFDAPGFIGDGTYGFPVVTNELINEDFSSYSVTQNHTSDSDCNTTDGWEIWNNFSSAYECSACVDDMMFIYGNNSSCTQNATALMSFTPTATEVNVSFAYRLRERSGRNDSFRVYLHDGSSQVGSDLIFVDNSGTVDTNTSYSGTATVVAGVTHTLRFEYINGIRAYGATFDNVIVSETSLGAFSGLGRGYIGNEVDCQIEFTYIDE